MKRKNSEYNRVVFTTLKINEIEITLDLKALSLMPSFLIHLTPLPSTLYTTSTC